MMKIDCPNFRLFVNNVQIGNYPTRADLYGAITLNGLNYNGCVKEWKESGLNRAWCERNRIKKLLDDCYIWTEKNG